MYSQPWYGAILRACECHFFLSLKLLYFATLELVSYGISKRKRVREWERELARFFFLRPVWEGERARGGFIPLHFILSLSAQIHPSGERERERESRRGEEVLSLFFSFYSVALAGLFLFFFLKFFPFLTHRLCCLPFLFSFSFSPSGLTSYYQFFSDCFLLPLSLNSCRLALLLFFAFSHSRPLCLPISFVAEPQRTHNI